MSIELEHVSFEYMPETPFAAVAVKDVNLTIRPGEFIGLIGHTGSGKSTLIQHLNGLIRPTAGRILVDGEDIAQKGYDLRALRRRVGLVFQYPEHQLFEETVEKDVRFGPKNLGLSPQEQIERARQAVLQVGLDWDSVKDVSPFDLSGGQRRRVAIAGVLAMQPETLVLDEPTAGLDPRGRDELIGLVMGLRRADTTIVLVTHNMQDIARSATRVIAMSHGEVALDAPPQEAFVQVEKLKSIGLDAPDCVKLYLRLKERGWKLPSVPLTNEALADMLLQEGVRPC